MPLMFLFQCGSINQTFGKLFRYFSFNALHRETEGAAEGKNFSFQS